MLCHNECVCLGAGTDSGPSLLLQLIFTIQSPRINPLCKPLLSGAFPVSAQTVDCVGVGLVSGRITWKFLFNSTYENGASQMNSWYRR